MNIIEWDDFADVYDSVLINVLDFPENIISPRGMKIKEATDVILRLKNPTSNLFKNSIRSIPLKYLAGELLWYFSGRNDCEFISRYSKFWSTIANEDGTNNSAYGNLLFKQKNEYGLTEWEWAYDSLVKDKDSRQALIRFNKPIHSNPNTKDFPCTIGGVFTIRGNKLNLSITMRSNDVYFGLIYDLPFFTILLQQMRLHLLPTYPDLELGEYRHHSISLHAYEKDWKTLENIEAWPFYPDGITLDTNLITPDGQQTIEFAACLQAVINNTPFESDSNFLNWLYNNAKN